MRIFIAGSRHFGAAVFDDLRSHFDVRIAGVAVPDVNDRLAVRAGEADAVLRFHHVGEVTEMMIPDNVDLIVAAHCHSRISQAALAKSRLGGIGYHPSLLPRHRGRDAVQQTIKCGDAITGGTVYHLSDVMDGGPVAFQDWCFVRPGETARQLWERALCPLGVELLGAAVMHAATYGFIPSEDQDDEFVNRRLRAA